MSTLLLARLQFAATTIYHFFFVPLTLGLSILVAIMETTYVVTGKEEYRRMTKFWGKLFLINFAMGVVTGIVQEFQFGMAWSEYARFVGDIFGAPLAVEALLAFFLESTFLGVWIFGWDKLSPRLHAVVIWLVAIGSNLSALWILIANSFMQEPVGFVLREGRAEMTNFFALLGNPNVWVQFPHVLFAGLATAGFFVIGISAWHLLRDERDEAVFKRSFQIGAVVAVIAAVLVIVNGHVQGQHMVQSQPMKMAAAEALWNTEDPASFSILTIGNEPERRDVFAIRIPSALSLLAYNRFTGQVKGINDLQAEYEQTYGPGNYVPPVALSYWSFRIMVGAGFLMLFLALLSVNYVVRDRVGQKAKFLRWLIPGIFLPYLANTSGWLLAELGRQPWIVFGLQRVEDAISPNITQVDLWLSLVLFVLIYGVLMAADIYLLLKYAKAGPSAVEQLTDSTADDAMPSLSGASSK